MVSHQRRIILIYNYVGIYLLIVACSVISVDGCQIDDETTLRNRSPFAADGFKYFKGSATHNVAYGLRPAIRSQATSRCVLSSHTVCLISECYCLKGIVMVRCTSGKPDGAGSNPSQSSFKRLDLLTPRILVPIGLGFGSIIGL